MSQIEDTNLGYSFDSIWPSSSSPEHELIASRSTRFIVFDKRAKIITEHQTEFQQILPHAGWHEQDPFDLVNAMRECMRKCVENLEWMGYSKDSIKGIGMSL